MCHVVRLFIDKRAMLASQRTRLQGNGMRPHSCKVHLLPQHIGCCQIPDHINEWTKAVLLHAESCILNMIYEPDHTSVAVSASLQRGKKNKT